MDNNQPVMQQPIAPVVAPMQPPVPSQSSSSKKRTLLLAGGFLVVILLFVYGIFLFFSSPNATQPVKSQLTPTPYIPNTRVTENPVPTIQGTIQLTLEKGKQITIPNSDVKILYVGSDLPNPNCMDCSTTTDVTLEQKNVEKKLQYLCGGIAGSCTDKLNGFGLQIELENATETTARVKIIEQ